MSMTGVENRGIFLVVWRYIIYGELHGKFKQINTLVVSMLRCRT